MTPRQADVACVLEDVGGVVAVYGLERVERAVGDLEFAVKLEHGAGHLAVAHYALLRVLSHDECKAVVFFEVELPPGLRARASRLDLSATDRDAARARVPATSAALQQEPAPGLPHAPEGLGFRALIIDSDVEAHRAVVEALGVAAERVIEPDPFAAFWKARAESFDLILCDSRFAFGRAGFLTQLLAADPLGARRVVLLAHEGERELLMSSLDELRCWNSFLCRPIDADTLREILRTGSVVQRWTIPILPPRGVALSKPETALLRRALVVDDDPATAMLLTSMPDGPVQVVVTSDEWEAVDALGVADLALVVCSVSMRTFGGTPFYRLLWNARPDIKRRFVFIARSDAAPVSTAEGRAVAVVQRPITREVINELVARVPRAPEEAP